MGFSLSRTLKCYSRDHAPVISPFLHKTKFGRNWLDGITVFGAKSAGQGALLTLDLALSISERGRQ